MNTFLAQPRFPTSCPDLATADHYFSNRSTQLRHEDLVPYGEVTPVYDNRGITDPRAPLPKPWGASARFRDEKTNDIFQSVYVFDDYRGQKLLPAYVADSIQRKGLPFITAPGCKGISSFFDHVKAPYRIVGQFTETLEYQLIQEFYGNQAAERSGIYYMNHIDEGLYILKKIGASEDAMRAYCLHPLFQANGDLQQQYLDLTLPEARARFPQLKDVSPSVLALAMEYRNIANAYLSWREIHTMEDIALSPLAEVNQMLIADKVQNYKDFILSGHRQNHPRSVALELYFLDWLERLGLSQKDFEDLASAIAGHPVFTHDLTLSENTSLPFFIRPSAQVALLRDDSEGLQIYLQRRPTSFRSFPGLWVFPGGKANRREFIDPHKKPNEPTSETVYEAALREASEEMNVFLRGRTFHLFKTRRTQVISRPNEQRQYLFPQYFVEANGLKPTIGEPQEADHDGWFYIHQITHDFPLSREVKNAILELKNLIEQGFLTTDQLFNEVFFKS